MGVLKNKSDLNFICIPAARISRDASMWQRNTSREHERAVIFKRHAFFHWSKKNAFLNRDICLLNRMEEIVFVTHVFIVQTWFLSRYFQVWKVILEILNGGKSALKIVEWNVHFSVYIFSMFPPNERRRWHLKIYQRYGTLNHAIHCKASRRNFEVVSLGTRACKLIGILPLTRNLTRI